MAPRREFSIRRAGQRRVDTTPKFHAMVVLSFCAPAFSGVLEGQGCSKID